MNKKEALQLLGLDTSTKGSSSIHDINTITKAYRVESLKHHPDKNENSPESTARFQKINEAYTYLLSKTHTPTPFTSSPQPNSYHELFIFFIRSMFKDNTGIQSSDIEAALIHIISSNYDKLLKTLDKATAISVYEFMHEYAEILHLPTESLERMFQIVSEKMRSDNVVLLNPTLSDVFHKKIYDLEYESKHFTVPLWHNEMYYRLDDACDLVVRCNICDVPEYMYIDENNHITISVRTSIQKLLETGALPVCIPFANDESINITVPSSDLIVTKKPQLYKCPDPIGIPKINTRNPFDSSVLAGISVCIELY
jgi:hypothetical protein